jgi:hypothetical protein
MNKHNLAEMLRQRQYQKGLVPEKLIRQLSDDEIINSYITCPDCGAKQVSSSTQLTAIIEAASCVDDFFAGCDAVSAGHGH